jgi:hypothetical protein
MHVSAALVENPTAVVDHTLYRGAVSSRSEGLYLCALLNSPAITDLVRPLMSYGKDERHIDKHVWKLPIPVFNHSNPTHSRLSNLGGQCAEFIASLDLDDSANFVTLRRRIRSALAAHPSAAEINERVLGLLSV